MKLSLLLFATASLTLPLSVYEASAQESFLDADGRPTRVPRTLQERGQALDYWIENGFRIADVNNDQRIDYNEWRRKSWFPSLIYDDDGDGRINEEEYLNQRCGGLPRSDQVFIWCISSEKRGFRRDSDGQYITFQTHERVARLTFRINDINRDGFVTQEEQRIAAQR